MDRRQFLATQAGVISSLAIFPAISAQSADFADMFEAMRGRQLPGQIDEIRLSSKGAVPAGLSGDFFKNGPALPQGYLRQNGHLFDGDGFIQRFRISPLGVNFTGRFVETSKYKAEQEHGDLFRQSFSTVWPGSPMIRSTDEINTGNTSIRQIGDQTMALWEAGSPHEIDPQTLETKGVVSFGEGLEGLPFSAHPKRDPAGGWWNFGQIVWHNKLVLYQLDDAGRQIKHALISTPHPGMIHDFAVTERFLIFVIPPFIWSEENIGPLTSFLDAHDWKKTAMTEILVIDKNDLTIARRYQSKASFVFHFANAFDDKNGDVHLDICRYETPRVVTNSLRWDGHSKNKHVDDTSLLTRLTLKKSSSEVDLETLTTAAVEFPRLPDDLQTRSEHRCLTLGIDTATSLFRSVLIVNSDTGSVQTYDLGPDSHADEHMFVRDADTGRLWVLGVYADLVTKTTKFHILDAENMAGGPVFIADLPYIMPSALHGDFVPHA
jgi:all-trans-8'-apo-beta-carotenal 15,15'-oxygenase